MVSRTINVAGVFVGAREIFRHERNVFSFHVKAAGSMLCGTAVMYGYGESVTVHISAHFQAMSKSTHQKLFGLTKAKASENIFDTATEV